MKHSQVKQRQAKPSCSIDCSYPTNQPRFLLVLENLHSAREHIPKKTGGSSYKNIVILSTESVLQPASHYSTTSSDCIFPEMPDKVTTNFAELDAAGFN